jgi:Zn-dependent protease with chaperone function
MFVVQFSDMFNSDDSSDKLYNITKQCISYIQENVTPENATAFGVSPKLLERLKNYHSIKITADHHPFSALCGIETPINPKPNDPICFTYNAFEIPNYTEQKQAKIIFHELAHIDTHHPENLAKITGKSYIRTIGGKVVAPILGLGILGGQIDMLHPLTDALRITAAFWSGLNLNKLIAANASQTAEYAADAFSDFMMPEIKIGDVLEEMDSSFPMTNKKTSWLMAQFLEHPTLLKRQKASDKNVVLGEALHQKHSLPAFELKF